MAFYLILIIVNEVNLQKELVKRVEKIETLCEIYNRSSLESKGIRLSASKYGAYLILEKKAYRGKDRI